MFGCEAVCEPTNRKKSFVRRRREQQTNNRFFFLFLLLVLSRNSNHMMLAVDITRLRAVGSQPTAVCWLSCCSRLRLIHPHTYRQTFCSYRQSQTSTAFFAYISLCPFRFDTYENGSKRMKRRRRRRRRKKTK